MGVDKLGVFRGGIRMFLLGGLPDSESHGLASEEGPVPITPADEGA